MFDCIDNEYPYAMCFSRLEDDAAQWERYADNAVACGYSHKHRSFRSEQEIRVVNLWGYIPKHATVETECVRGIIKKFMKFNVEERCKEVGLAFEDLFEGIVIGPKSAQDIGNLQTFVEEKGFASLKSKISKSDCPLR